MPVLSRRAIFIAVIACLILGGLWGWQYYQSAKTAIQTETTPVATSSVRIQTIGSSVQGRKIEAYLFGSGPSKLLFVGGMHGGYEWNSVTLAYQAIDYFTQNPENVPDNLSVIIIPDINPDGIFLITGKEGRIWPEDALSVSDNDTLAGRLNANLVDLNRNFDCKWQATGTWRNKPVSAGTSAFSEPESQALRDFVSGEKPSAVVFWHSQSGQVYASECEHGILPETTSVMNLYAQASGYKPASSFSSYQVTGDAEGWLASINVPAVTVELTNHQDIEWEKNLAGMQSLISHFSQKN